ncbi:MAG TPA: hypothetical protein VIL74_24105 [Pyrinomonadaceae bacterium]|jgi:hypothetical protein
MYKRNTTALFVLLAAIFAFSATASAQETEAATRSNLTGVQLPAGASRVLPGSVPAQITGVFDKITAAGDGKIRQGDSEVLVWGGADYRKANADGIVTRLTAALQAAGWQYSVQGSEGGLTVFSAVKEGAGRRAVVGFHGATDDALIFSWMEILSASGAANNQIDAQPTENIQNAPVRNTGGGSIVGTWTNGTTSMNYEKYTNGTTAFRNGSTYKYVFYADGRFEFIGLMASTMYGCTTTLFNDKRGKYQISGNQITFTPSKNFWRNQYSCAPNSNKERDYTLDQETYSFRTKQDEYGKTLICLDSGKGEACYRRED